MTKRIIEKNYQVYFEHFVHRYDATSCWQRGPIKHFVLAEGRTMPKTPHNSIGKMQQEAWASKQ